MAEIEPKCVYKVTKAITSVKEWRQDTLREEQKLKKQKHMFYLWKVAITLWIS